MAKQSRLIQYLNNTNPMVLRGTVNTKTTSLKEFLENKDYHVKKNFLGQDCDKNDIFYFEFQSKKYRIYSCSLGKDIAVIGDNTCKGEYDNKNQTWLDCK